MQTIVSIIIATSNSGKTLRTALDSVLNQKFQDWECIVVDGASKDDTVKIVEEYEQRDSRFRHISETDHGIYDAFNKGWRMAKGEWIHYLGSDDRLTGVGFFDLTAESHDDVDVVTGDVWIEKIDGTVKANLSEGFYGCHQGKLVRRSVMERMNGFDEQYRILADKDLMVRMEKAGIRVKNIRSMVSYFAMDGASQSVKGEWKRYKERVKIHKNNNLPGCAEFECAKIHLRIIASVIYRKIKNKLIH